MAYTNNTLSRHSTGHDVNRHLVPQHARGICGPPSATHAELAAIDLERRLEAGDLASISSAMHAVEAHGDGDLSRHTANRQIAGDVGNVFPARHDARALEGHLRIARGMEE